MASASITALVVLAFALFPAAVTLVCDKRMIDVGQDDVVFTDGTVFETSARSKLDCARHCLSHDGCQTFTFSRGPCKTCPGTCRGNSATGVTPTSAREPAASAAKTYRRAGNQPASGEYKDRLGDRT